MSRSGPGAFGELGPDPGLPTPADRTKYLPTLTV